MSILNQLEKYLVDDVNDIPFSQLPLYINKGGKIGKNAAELFKKGPRPSDIEDKIKKAWKQRMAVADEKRRKEKNDPVIINKKELERLKMDADPRNRG